MGNDSKATLSSVDNALQVLELFSRQPSLRVIEVADHLGVARSTAHRILTALVARGFVVQDAHRVYHGGPAIDRFKQPQPSAQRPTKDLVHPHLQRLATTVGETCAVAVLEGNGTRFIDGVQSLHTPRIGPRTGMLLPAHMTAIGIAQLAELPIPALKAIYPRGLTGDARDARQTLADLERKIRRARRAGFTTNQGESDPGVYAVATCLRNPHGRAFAGISIAIPTSRYDQHARPELVKALTSTVEAIKDDLTAREYGDVPATDSPKLA